MGFVFCYSSQQEFIKKPKEKKEQVSEQQCLEVQADIIMAINKLASESASLVQEVLAIQESKINNMNDYCDGQRIAKEQRVVDYKQDTKLKQQLEKASDCVHAAREEIKSTKSEDKK